MFDSYMFLRQKLWEEQKIIFVNQDETVGDFEIVHEKKALTAPFLTYSTSTEDFYVSGYEGLPYSYFVKITGAFSLGPWPFSPSALQYPKDTASLIVGINMNARANPDECYYKVQTNPYNYKMELGQGYNYYPDDGSAPHMGAKYSVTGKKMYVDMSHIPFSFTSIITPASNSGCECRFNIYARHNTHDASFVTVGYIKDVKAIIGRTRRSYIE